MIRCGLAGLAILALCLGASQTHAAGNPAQGLFAACAACHSLRPDQNLTGLAGLWNRKLLGSNHNLEFAGIHIEFRCYIRRS
jgi:cytochrome c2